MWSKVTPIKVGVGLKRRREPSKRRLGWRLAWWVYTEKKEASHFLRLKGRHQYSHQRSNQKRASCVASTTLGQRGKRPNGQIISIKRATDGRRERSWEIIDEEKEKSTGPRTDPRET